MRDTFWRDILTFGSLGSTNDYLKELARAGAPEGTVVIAREQTAGKGRLGRAWASPPGGAWLSLLLRPKIALEQAGCISILLGVALAQAMREEWGGSVGVKWPNDLYISSKVREFASSQSCPTGFRKLGGILIELSSQAERIEWLVAGIGVNVNNEPPAQVPATSLAHELDRKIALEEFFGVALKAIERDYQRFLIEGFDFVRRRWQELSILGGRVTVMQGTRSFEAEVLDLAKSGKLIVRTEQGLRELTAEEVTLT